MLPKPPDPKKLLPDLSALLNPFHPDNLPKPKKRKSVLESYLGTDYKRKLKNALVMSPESFPAEIKQKMLTKQPLNEHDQYEILRSMS